MPRLFKWAMTASLPSRAIPPGLFPLAYQAFDCSLLAAAEEDIGMAAAVVVVALVSQELE
jgi:hypothetical protein